MDQIRVAIDIDGCLANFQQRFLDTAKRKGYSDFPTHWTQWRSWLPPDIKGGFGDLFDEIEEDELWWGEISPYDDAHLPVAPDAYLTARPVSSAVTENWLSRHGFPEAPVYTVGVDNSKVPIMREKGIDLLVDDRPKTFDQVNQEREKTCLLMNRPYNQHVPSESGFYSMDDAKVIPVDLRLMYLSNLQIWISEYGDLL